MTDENPQTTMTQAEFEARLMTALHGPNATTIARRVLDVAMTDLRDRTRGRAEATGNPSDLQAAAEAVAAVSAFENPRAVIVVGECGKCAKCLAKKAADEAARSRMD